jgi:hypothetical protein
MMPDFAETRRPAAAAWTIFFAVACTLLCLHANRLILSLDEGVVLEAAQRMLHGKRLYTDFFVPVSPGSFWLRELAFRLLGLSLRAGRLMVILDFAALCALTFSLVARLVSWKAGLAVVVVYFGLVASNPVTSLPTHRWDSAALSLLSIALCLKGAESGRGTWWIIAGVLAAVAVFCTPTTILIIPITCVAFIRSFRRFLLPYLAAACATAAVLMLAMAAGGYLTSFFEQMLWLNQNYAGVNVTPYGYLNGGWEGFTRATAGAPLPVRPFLLLCAVLPAVLPVVAFAGWGLIFVLRRNKVKFPIPYLLACMVGYVMSTWPRPDVGHLTTVAPLGYVLVAALIGTTLKPAARGAIFLAMLPWALLPLLQAGFTMSAETTLPTPVGQLRVAREDENNLSRLLSLVRPGQGLYVHPYLPLFYFLTQADNPTRFSYLGPAMMTDRDEQSVLADLERKPPAWILYLYVNSESLANTFPSAKTRNPRFDKIENWIQQNYAPADPPLQISSYRLLARKPDLPPQVAARHE